MTKLKTKKMTKNLNQEFPENMVYVDMPKDYDPIFAVSACFCKFEDTFLFLKRSSHKPYGDTWSLPAGKIEKDETPLQTVIRETFEETMLQLRKDNVFLLKKVYVRYPTFDFDYYMFKTELTDEPDIQLNDEHQDFQFVKLEQAIVFNLIPGESECIKLVHDKLV